MRLIKFKKRSYYIPIAILLFSSVIIAQDTSTKKSIFDVMSHKEVLAITLEADFTDIDTNRRSPNARKAVLSFEDENGTKQTWNVKLKARGNFRRLRCEMTPLKMEFKKKDLKAAGLAKFDDMKMVTHCVSNKYEAKTFLQKEYLAYKLFNELIDNSFRVQLLKITYVDIKTDEKTKHWAFLIEDTAELRSRIGASQTVANAIGLPKDTFHIGQLKIASVFQYMIGNSDWDLNVGRNMKFLVKNEKVIAVPYDFDFSGMVATSYAIPNPNYGISSTKTRIFLGFQEDAKHLKSTLSYFKTKQKDLIKIINKFKVLDFIKRDQVIEYVNSFYATIDTIVLGEKVTFHPETEVVSLKDLRK